MIRMLLLVLAINLSACNILDGSSGSSSSTGSGGAENTSNLTDQGSEILMAEEATDSDSEESSDYSGADEDVDAGDAQDESEIESEVEADEVVDEESTTDTDCSISDFLKGQIEICSESVSYLFIDSNSENQRVLLSDFQVGVENFHVVTSFIREVDGSFLSFPADSAKIVNATIAIPSTIAATGRPGAGHELILQINSDIHCLYTSYSNKGYRSPVCYQGSKVLDNGALEVMGAVRVPASIFTEVNYLRAHIRMANGKRELTTANIDIQVLLE